MFTPPTTIVAEPEMILQEMTYTVKVVFGASVMVDTTGDGLGNAVGATVETASGQKLTQVGAAVDTTGDGMADAVGIDTTGDGVVDKVVANRDQTQSATSVKLVCPPNANPGDTLVFLHPVTNNPITAVVPPGTRPGAPFAVRFPLSLA